MDKILKLPKVGGKPVEFEHFPTRMQAFIFKNYDTVPESRLAQCLGTSVENVRRQAGKMGLAPQGDVSAFAERGYITVIRANWHLLPYNQLLSLLGMTEEQLAFTLKEEDFLDTKLGNEKPDCEEIRYAELTEEQEKQTEYIRETVQKYFKPEKNAKPPFEFFEKLPPAARADYIKDETGDENAAYMAARFAARVGDFGKTVTLRLFAEKRGEEYHEVRVSETGVEITAADSAGILRGLTFTENLIKNSRMQPKLYKRKPRFKTRFIYSFSGLYNDALDVDSEVYCPDELLDAYADAGVNGIWIQAVLYRITEFPFMPSLSEGWRQRLARLADFVRRAARFGIKIYLYINEPRGMPLEFFKGREDILGNMRDGTGCLCTSTERVQKYLHNSVKYVCEAVPKLGGFFTITHSENITNCYSLTTEGMACPRCRNRKPADVIAEVNKIIAEAAGEGIKVFAWNWTWRKPFMSEEEIISAIEKMPKNVIYMSNREAGVKMNIDGVENEVDDYSISVCGIGEETLLEWRAANESGHETAAKLQINNSWECSTLPYMPVYALLTDNVKQVARAGAEHLMLSWTLGGYPSPSIKIISAMFFDDGEETDFDGIMTELYGEYAGEAKAASDIFSEAFKLFPFDVDTLYTGPQNAGASNPLYMRPTGRKATMTCYAFDDLESWRSLFTEDILENRFGRMCDKWEEGLEIIKDMPQCEFKDMAEGTYIQLKSSHNQIRFIRLRNAGRLGETAEIVKAEQKLAVRLHKIMERNPAVGFEAANHYYYTQGMLKEKAVICEYILNNSEV